MTDTDRNIADATTAGSAADHTANLAAGTAEDLAGGVRDTTRDAAEAADAAKEQVAGAVNDVIDSAKAKAADVAEKAADAAETVTAQAKDAYANARSAADEGVGYVKARYRENPGLVIGVAVAALVAVGIIVRAISRR